MNTELSQVFAFDDNAVRTAGTFENPLFVATDVCRALGLGNASETVATVPAEEKGIKPFDTLGGNQELLVITEVGLYQIIFRSDKPEAARFRKWVFSEVLPAIRKTGAYSTNSPAPDREWLQEAYGLAKSGKVQWALLVAMGVVSGPRPSSSSSQWQVPPGVDGDAYWEAYWNTWWEKQRAKQK